MLHRNLCNIYQSSFSNGRYSSRVKAICELSHNSVNSFNQEKNPHQSECFPSIFSFKKLKSKNILFAGKLSILCYSQNIYTLFILLYKTIFDSLSSEIMVRVSSTKASTYLVILTKTVGNVPQSVKTWTNIQTHKETAEQKSLGI